MYPNVYNFGEWEVFMRKYHVLKDFYNFLDGVWWLPDRIKVVMLWFAFLLVFRCTPEGVGSWVPRL